MGFFTKDIQTINDLFVHTLRGIYYAEQRILQALATMIEKTTGPQLGAAFEHHLAATRNHVRRVEQVFEKRDAKRTTVNCPAIDGIIREAKEVIGEVEVEDKAVLGAALVAAAQAVEHYENGSLISWARGLGRDDCASVLQENLDEEKAADETLREIAESEVNIQASVT